MDSPAISILIVSHNKPRLLPEAVASVLGQTFSEWQGILIDSGSLHDRGFFDEFAWSSDPRLRIMRSGETPALRRRKAMAPWCFNECFRRGWVQGELVMYLCDDDILYPEAFATFVEAFKKNSAAMAMYASQDIGWIGPDGRCEIVGERRACASGGKKCAGRIMDCQVDYLQLCHRRSALRRFARPRILARGEGHWRSCRRTVHGKTGGTFRDSSTGYQGRSKSAHPMEREFANEQAAVVARSRRSTKQSWMPGGEFKRTSVRGRSPTNSNKRLPIFKPNCGNCANRTTPNAAGLCRGGIGWRMGCKRFCEN